MGKGEEDMITEASVKCKCLLNQSSKRIAETATRMEPSLYYERETTAENNSRIKNNPRNNYKKTMTAKRAATSESKVQRMANHVKIKSKYDTKVYLSFGGLSES